MQGNNNVQCVEDAVRYRQIVRIGQGKHPPELFDWQGAVQEQCQDLGTDGMQMRG